jgi:hypothetical protein
MRRAHDKSSGVPTGAQDEQATGATGTGTTSGAAATGTAGQQAGGQEVAGQRQQTATASYGRGTEPSAEWRTAGEAHAARSGNAMGGVLSVVAGLLAFLGGLAFIIRPHFYPTLNGYAYHWAGTGWGWVILILGVVLFAAGASVLLGVPQARPVAVGLAVLTAIAGFLFLVYSPFWGIVLVALSVFAIWGLLQGVDEHDRSMI